MVPRGGLRRGSLRIELIVSVHLGHRMSPVGAPAAGNVSAEELIIVFGSVPSLGSGLKEIAATHGAQAAYRLQRLLLDLCVEHASALPVRKWFRYPAGTPAPTLSSDWSVRSHEPGTVGEQITLAMSEGFERGFERIVQFYADCPSLVPEYLESAFECLEDVADLVMGPTPRGTLYLAGARRTAGQFFGTLPWGTFRVFEVAQRHATVQGLKVALLPRKPVVQDLEDWKAVAAEGWIPPPPAIQGGKGRPEG